MTYGALLSLFPPRLREAVTALFPTDPPEEIRIRRCRPVSLTAGGETLLPGVTLNGNETDRLFSELCLGSSHAFEVEIGEGYVPLGDGVRLGLGGTFDLTGEGSAVTVRGVRQVETLVLRLPHEVPDAALPVYRIWEKKGFRGGILLYAPPGGGKTTVLRDLARLLGGKNCRRRAVVIDDRREIFQRERFEDTVTDFVTGLPKQAGFELAVRALSPEVLLCDELGASETEGIRRTAGSGVPLIATVHASSFTELKARPGIGELLADGVFPTVIGIIRKNGALSFREETLSPGVSSRKG